MEDKLTVDEILAWLRSNIESRNPISPHVWIEAAARLNILMGDEVSRMYYLKQKVNQMRAEKISGGDNVTKAKALIEATDDYRDSKILEGKLSVIEESIRIAKLMARTSLEEMKGGM